MTLDRLSHPPGKHFPVVVVGDDRSACIALRDRMEDAAGNLLAKPASHRVRIARERRFREASLPSMSGSAVSRDLTPDLTPRVSV